MRSSRREGWKVKRGGRGGYRQRGASIAETTVVLPLLTLLGLGLLQYILLFNAKNNMNYAAFEAARAGSAANANLTEVRKAYTRALVPLYGGGISQAELQESYEKAQADVDRYAKVELLNPTQESFHDWNSEALQDKYGTQKRVIPNAWQEVKGRTVGAQSGQSIQDANLLKIRVLHGYEPKIPFAASVFRTYLKWLDTGEDTYKSELIEAGRIPVQTVVTLHMTTDAIEPDETTSSPGGGNGGKPTDPGDPPMTERPAPDCVTMGCTVLGDGSGGGGSGGGSGNGGGSGGDAGGDGPGMPSGGGDGEVCQVLFDEKGISVLERRWPSSNASTEGNTSG